MKVLYIVNSTQMAGGASKSFLTLLMGMKKKGVSTYVITPDENDMHVFLKEQGIPCTVVSFRMNVYPDVNTIKDIFLFFPRIFGRVILKHRATSRIIEICQKEKIDLIHTNVSLISCGWDAAKQLHIPHIWHVREYADLDFNYHHFPSRQAFYKKIHAKNSYSICITKGIQNYLHLESNEQSKQIYNGIEPMADVGQSEFHDQAFFLFAGRMEPSKAPLEVVKAFQLFSQKHKDESISLIMAGDISNTCYWQNIQTYIAQHALESKVKYVGNRKDIGQLMSEALATIVASEFEAFGRCLPEAMINNGLTIGKNTSGTKEQYDNGLALSGKEIGLRYMSQEELTLAMEHVYQAPKSSFNEMKQRAKETVKSLYSKDKYVNDIFSFYQQILSETKPSLI